VIRIVALFMALALASGMAGCTSQPASTGKAVDSHNSRNSLSWAGLYEGVLPCADCPGIKARLTLRRDYSYELVTDYLDRPLPPQTARGQFTWNTAGGTITLEGAGGGQTFMVGEGRLLQLNRDGTPLQVDAPTRVLMQVRVD
jgi:uncharacterized lipoprotein NlpE involved in copper resistance